MSGNRLSDYFYVCVRLQWMADSLWKLTGSFAGVVWAFTLSITIDPTHGEYLEHRTH